MSVCLKLICRECRKYLWVGQDDYIYTGDQRIMMAMGKFLIEHRHHNLMLTDEYVMESHGCDYEKTRP